MARAPREHPSNESPAKKARVESPTGKDFFNLTPADIAEVTADIADVAKTLSDLDDECAKQQMAIQRESEIKKKPHLNARDVKIGKVPKLWAACVTAPCHTLITQAETKMFADYLESVALEDNLDDHGTYEVTFHFKADAEKIFTPITWTKKTVFKSDGAVDAEKTVITAVEFKDDKQDPRIIVEMIGAGETVEGEEDLEDADSITAWFGNKEESSFEFGELFRRFIYPHPFAPFEESSDAEGDDEEDEDDK